MISNERFKAETTPLSDWPLKCATWLVDGDPTYGSRLGPRLAEQ